jgi:uncharacterized protein YkwD
VRRLVVFIAAALFVTPAGLAAGEPAGNRLGPTSYGPSTSWQLSGHEGFPRPWSSSLLTEPVNEQAALDSGLLREINAVRSEHGLKTLTLSAKLSAAAAQHTREMGEDGYFDHESYDKTPFWKRIEHWYRSKGWHSWSVGENLLYSSPDVTVTDGIDLWMNSPPHRANLLSRSWREIGISSIHFDAAPGEFGGDPVTIVTADFGVRR